MSTTALREAASAATAGMSAEEWRLRCDLAACYQLVDLYGLTDLSSNHISVRVPGPEDHFLINPLGILYDEITASCLLKIDVDGKVISGDPRKLNPAGFVIHSAIHMAQRDMACVLHTHTRATNAVGATKEGLLPLTQKACLVLGWLKYHDYEGPSTELGERERIVRDMGEECRVICMRNHGALALGGSIAEAFVWMHRYETACRYQVDAMACAAGGATLNPIPAETVKVAIERVKMLGRPGAPFETGTMEWASLLRRLERARGTSYRT